MELKWTSKALSDLARLYDFLVLASKPTAARTVQSLTQEPVILLTHPRIGEQLFQFEPRGVRRIFADEYELLYELTGQACVCDCGIRGKTDRLSGVRLFLKKDNARDNPADGMD